MFRRTDRSGTAVALVAALLLVLQSFASAWAAGAMPAGPSLDAFGNPLCVTGTVDAGKAGGAPSSVPNCCAMGCSLAAPLVAPPEDTAGIRLPERLDTGSVFVGLPSVSLALHDHDPGNPRAPPPTA